MACTVYDRWEIETPHNQFRIYGKTPFFVPVIVVNEQKRSKF